MTQIKQNNVPSVFPKAEQSLCIKSYHMLQKKTQGWQNAEILKQFEMKMNEMKSKDKNGYLQSAINELSPGSRVYSQNQTFRNFK